MKKNWGWIAVFAVLSGIIFSGCPSAPEANPLEATASETFEEFKSGTVIRNKVVDVNSNGYVYYEYLAFESGSEGQYSLYKCTKGSDGKDVFTKLTTYTNASGVETAVPTAFTYSKKNGKFTADENSCYMLKSTKDGKETSVIASELLKSSANAIFSKWTDSVSFTFEFVSDGTCKVSKDDYDTETKFTNENGWITLTEGLSFLWTGSNLYKNAYATERTEVEEAGRSISNIIEMNSTAFMLVK